MLRVGVVDALHHVKRVAGRMFRGLTFIKVTGDITKPNVKLGFAGKIGAVTAGFEYFADQDGQMLAFNISGQHQWKIGTTEVDFNWESALGFSSTKFQAKAHFNLDETRQDGQKLQIKGNLSLQHEDGTPATDPANPLALSIDATYSFEDNVLVLRASVSEENGELNYDLQMEGTFQFDGLTLKFGVKFTNNTQIPQFNLELASKDDPASLIHNLALTLNIDESQAIAQISLSFELDMRWASGIRVIAQSKRLRRVVSVGKAILSPAAMALAGNERNPQSPRRRCFIFNNLERAFDPAFNRPEACLTCT